MNQTAFSVTPQYLTSDGATPTVPYWIDALLPSGADGYAALLGPNKTFNYYFADTPPVYFTSTDRVGFRPFTDPQKIFFKQAFAYISSVIDVRFVETSTPDGPNTITLADNIQQNSAGYGSYPSTNRHGNDLLLNSSPDNLDPREGKYSALTAIHELGHTLGLKHPFGYPDAIGNVTNGPYLPDAEDNTAWSVMSDHSNPSEYLLRYSPFDIAALQYLYGPSKAQQSNDIIKLNPDASNFIWDGGGIDTLDGSALTQPLTLSLRPGSRGMIGAYNALISSNGQIAINYGTVIENITTGNAGDSIEGNGANNFINTGAGNDTVIGSVGVDTIDGGSGLDTMILNGAHANFQLTKTVGSWNFNGNTATLGSDVLINVERALFTDTALALDIGGSAGQAYRLYQAAFDRKPDLSGIGFWIHALDTGVTLSDVASGFIGSAEYQARLGVNPGNTAQVVQIYANVLHRVPDLDGFNFWKGHLDQGDLGLTQLLVNFSESPENQTQVIGSTQNGIEFTPFG